MGTFINPYFTITEENRTLKNNQYNPSPTPFAVHSCYDYVMQAVESGDFAYDGNF